MNKLSKILLFVITIVGAFLGINKVDARTYEGQIKAGPYVGGPFYVMHTRGCYCIYTWKPLRNHRH